MSCFTTLWGKIHSTVSLYQILLNEVSWYWDISIVCLQRDGKKYTTCKW